MKWSFLLLILLVSCDMKSNKEGSTQSKVDPLVAPDSLNSADILIENSEAYHNTDPLDGIDFDSISHPNQLPKSNRIDIKNPALIQLKKTDSTAVFELTAVLHGGRFFGQNFSLNNDTAIIHTPLISRASFSAENGWKIQLSKDTVPVKFQFTVYKKTFPAHFIRYQNQLKKLQ